MDLKNLDEEHGLAVDRWLSGSVAAAALKGDAFLCFCIPDFREVWDHLGYGTMQECVHNIFKDSDLRPSAWLVRAALCLWGSGDITSDYLDLEDRAAKLRQDIETLGSALRDGTITLEMIQAEIKRRIGGYYDDQE